VAGAIDPQGTEVSTVADRIGADAFERLLQTTAV
jgi:hypothetical protein